MVRTYVMFRDWSGYPEWLDMEMLSAVDDDALAPAFEAHVAEVYKRLSQAEQDQLDGPDGPMRMNDYYNTGDRRYLPCWQVIAAAPSDVAASDVAEALKLRLRPRGAFRVVPQSQLARPEWMTLERKIEELAHEISSRPLEKHPLRPNSQPKQRDLYIWEKLHVEALELVRVAGGGPPRPDSDSSSKKPEAMKSEEVSGDVANGSHGTDFLWLYAQGARYTFTKGQQAQVIRVLFEEWDRGGRIDGSPLTEETIGDKVSSISDRFRIQKVFEGHPALNTVLSTCGKGAWALFINAAPTTGQRIPG